MFKSFSMLIVAIFAFTTNTSAQTHSPNLGRPSIRSEFNFSGGGTFMPQGYSGFANGYGNRPDAFRMGPNYGRNPYGYYNPRQGIWYGGTLYPGDSLRITSNPR